jgi:hypothetical protein
MAKRTSLLHELCLPYHFCCHRVRTSVTMILWQNLAGGVPPTRQSLSCMEHHSFSAKPSKQKPLQNRSFSLPTQNNNPRSRLPLSIKTRPQQLLPTQLPISFCYFCQRNFLSASATSANATSYQLLLPHHPPLPTLRLLFSIYSLSIASCFTSPGCTLAICLLSSRLRSS